MKALREFFVVILSIALVSITTALGILVGVKDMFQGSIMTEGIKEMVKFNDDSEEFKEMNEAIDKVTNYKGTDEIVNSIIEDISNSNEQIVISDKTYDLLLKALEENKEEFIKLGASEQDINEAIEEIKKPENRQKMTQEFNDGFKENGAEIKPEDIQALKTVTSIVSPKITKRMVLAIVVIIALIALLTFSPYKWIRPVSICAIISGFNLLACNYAFGSISNMVVSEGVNWTLDASKLAQLGYPLFFGGIAGVVTYAVINSLAKKSKVDVGDAPTSAVTEEVKQTPEPAFKSTKYCASCGQPVNIDDTVCPTCGAPLE